jgi:DNA-binding Lrp family transcriptional regulator
VTAYILVETAPGAAGRVAESARGLAGVRQANAVTGPYDVIVQVEAETLGQIGRVAVTAIQSLEGVLRTLTCLVVD